MAAQRAGGGLVPPRAAVASTKSLPDWAILSIGPFTTDGNLSANHGDDVEVLPVAPCLLCGTPAIRYDGEALIADLEIGPTPIIQTVCPDCTQRLRRLPMPLVRALIDPPFRAARERALRARGGAR